MKNLEINHISLDIAQSFNDVIIVSYVGPREAYKMYCGNPKIFKIGNTIGRFYMDSIYPFLKSLENQITIDDYILFYSYDSPKMAKELLRLTTNENENTIFTVSLPSETLVRHGIIKRKAVNGSSRNIPIEFTNSERNLVYTFKPKFNRFFRDFYYKGVCVYD